MASEQNTPSPEQIEQARKWYISRHDLHDLAVTGLAEGDEFAVRDLAAYAAHVQAQAAPVQSDRTNWIYEDQLPEMSKEAYHEWYLKSDVVHGVRMGPSVQPAYVYSKDYEALYELLCKGGEAMGMMQGYLERVPVQITKTWTFLGDKKHFLAEGVRCNLEWVSVNGEKERSGPSVEEVMEAWGATLDKWKHELKGDGFDTSAGHEAAYAEWIAAKARSAEGSVTAQHP